MARYRVKGTIYESGRHYLDGQIVEFDEATAAKLGSDLEAVADDVVEKEQVKTPNKAMGKDKGARNKAQKNWEDA